MWIILYDEGMYPELQARGLTCVKAADEKGAVDTELWDRRLVASATSRSGKSLAIYDQRIDSVIRGLHYVNETANGLWEEEEPVAADLLNLLKAPCPPWRKRQRPPRHTIIANET